MSSDLVRVGVGALATQAKKFFIEANENQACFSPPASFGGAWLEGGKAILWKKFDWLGGKGVFLAKVFFYRCENGTLVMRLDGIKRERFKTAAQRAAALRKKGKELEDYFMSLA